MNVVENPGRLRRFLCRIGLHRWSVPGLRVLRATAEGESAMPEDFRFCLNAACRAFGIRSIWAGMYVWRWSR